MRNIELSTMVPQDALYLNTLEQQTLLHAIHRQFDWETAWNHVLQIALYQKGPEVSEVGSTWLENLAEMNALRPFSLPEQKALGGMASFLSTALPSDSPLLERIVSIPWTLDTRLIFYRKDALAKAGVSEKGAFDTPEALYETLARLQASGYPYPLSMITGGFSLHQLASFIWGRGCDFRSDDYRKLTLTEPEARRGMKDYFQLHRFIDPKHRPLIYHDSDQLFVRGNVPVLISGQWTLQRIKNVDRDWGITDDVIENTGYAMLPGVPYVGGSHLVVWRHSLHDQEAMQLISFLTSPVNLRKTAPAACVFPARAETLNAAPYKDDPDFKLVADCLRKGRGLRSGRMWAAIEVRLSTIFEQMWTDLFADPELNLDVEVERRITDLATRLERTLLSGS